MFNSPNPIDLFPSEARKMGLSDADMNIWRDLAASMTECWDWWTNKALDEQSGTKPGTLIAMELGIQRNLLYKWAETLVIKWARLEFFAAEYTAPCLFMPHHARRSILRWCCAS